MTRFMITGVVFIALAGSLLIIPAEGRLTAANIKMIEITVKNTTGETVMIYVDCRYIGSLEANKSVRMAVAADLKSPIKVAAYSTSDETWLRVRRDNRAAHTWIVSQ